MTFRGKEYKIENDGIWIDKKVLEEWRNHYNKVSHECNMDKSKLLSCFYIGKAEVLKDLLDMFEPLEGL